MAYISVKTHFKMIENYFEKGKSIRTYDVLIDNKSVGIQAKTEREVVSVNKPEGSGIISVINDNGYTFSFEAEKISEVKQKVSDYVEKKMIKLMKEGCKDD